MGSVSVQEPVEYSHQPAERKYATTEPFFLEGIGQNAETALLLIHGFTGSPSEFRRLGYYLNDLGYAVKAILLPGHGTSPEDMICTGFSEWWDGVRTEFTLLREQYQRIIPIGHSMGGLLSLKLAMEEQVQGVVSLATPIHLGSRLVACAGWLQFFVKYAVKRRAPGTEHIINEALAYDRTPLRCVVDLRKLLFQVRKKLDQVDAPLFIAQGERDRTSLPRSAPFIFNKVSSQQKEMKVYPNSAHGILLDSERDQVYEDIGSFLAQLT